MNPTREFVGTWEEIVAHSSELAGQRVRVTVLPASEATQSGAQDSQNARPIWEEFDEITAKIPQAELEKLPTDASERLDHYLYGDPGP